MLVSLSSKSNPLVAIDENVPETEVDQTVLNLNFEQITPDLKPKRWYLGGQGYEVQIDQTQAFSGSKSLRMRYLSGSSFGVATSQFPIEDAMEVDWAIQDARVVLQAASPQLRDKSMAENVDWILQHSPPETKIVLWAHNGHVGKKPSWMGKYLDERHGNDMVVFGFCFHEGRYTAVGSSGLGTYSTSPSEAGSAEWAFHRTGLPRFMLDLRLASPGDPNSAWLTKAIDFRSIGALALSYAFYQTVLTDDFDVLIYFDQAHPSVLLPGYTGKFNAPN